MPAEIESGRERPGEQTFILALSGRLVEPVGRGNRDREEIDAGIERRAAKLGSLDVAGGQHSGKQYRELRILASAKLEVQVVDAEDRKREGVRRIDGHAHRHGPSRSRRALADDAFVPLLHEVAQPLVGLPIHDAVASPGASARLFERGIVDAKILERDDLLDEDVPAGDQDDLPGGQAGEEKDRPVANRRDRPVCQDLLVGHHRRGETRLHGGHLDPRERLALDPHGPSIERPRVILSGIEPHDVAVVLADALGALESIAIVGRRTAVEAAATAPSPPAATETVDDRRPTWIRSPRTRAPPTRCRRPRRSTGCRSPRRSRDPSWWDGNAAPCAPRRCSCERARPAHAAAAGAGR